MKAARRPVVLITGAGGLIGLRLVDALADRYTVVGLDRDQDRIPTGASDWLEADLTQDASVATALRALQSRHGDQLASVIHLAAYYDFAGEPSPLYQSLTVDGTRRLLRELRSFTLEQFVFSSSLLVMKPSETGELLTEESPTEAKWDYPQSKLAAEAVIREERRNWGPQPPGSVILRIAGVYDEDCHSIPISQQISRIYERKLESWFFPGNDEHGQAFVHLEDLADCFVRVVDRRTQLSGEELFLIAEPDVMTYAELQSRIGERLYGTEWPSLWMPKPLAKAGAWIQNQLSSEEQQQFIKPWMIDLADDHYPVDITRARQRLGWEPRHLLRDTIDVMLERLKRDPERWYQVNKLPLPDEWPAVESTA